MTTETPPRNHQRFVRHTGKRKTGLVRKTGEPSRHTLFSLFELAFAECSKASGVASGIGLHAVLYLLNRNSFRLDRRPTFPVRQVGFGGSRLNMYMLVFSIGTNEDDARIRGP